jgi:glutaredoxin
MEIKSVTVYSTVTCPFCRLLKDWFRKKDVKYANVFVDEDEAAADLMIKMSGQMGVPVTEIEFENGKKEIVVGFDKPKIAKILKIEE